MKIRNIVLAGVAVGLFVGLLSACGRTPPPVPVSVRDNENQVWTLTTEASDDKWHELERACVEKCKGRRMQVEEWEAKRPLMLHLVVCNCGADL